MIRTQIQLHQKQERALRRFAQNENISQEEAVRRCIDKALASENDTDLQDRYNRASSIIGSFSDAAGASDLSSNHDDYLKRRDPSRCLITDCASKPNMKQLPMEADPRSVVKRGGK